MMANSTLIAGFASRATRTIFWTCGRNAWGVPATRYSYVMPPQYDLALTVYF
jgi:hypothetical protein